MRENTILKISLICSLIGLIALYFISENIEVKEYTGRSINSNIGDDVKLEGTVKNVRKTQNAAFIEVEQKVPLKVVVLKNEKRYLGAVGAYYQNFPQVSDEEVIELLEQAQY